MTTSTLAQTLAGPVRGRERRGALQFAGIPYAAAPVGSLRFAAPRPPQPWSDERDATRFGPPAPQLSDGSMTNAAPIEWSEDCLTLNVCTPALDDSRRPVMVWIHGGGYRNGTGAIPWYDGNRFATEGDVVTVTINYRLGALGFLRVADEPTSGINGTLDQVEALRWVRDNIAAFGGDPDQVTVAGESAGAFSVATLMSLAPAEGLFHRAILQSGAGHHVHSEAMAEANSTALHDYLGATTTDELRKFDVDQILAAQKHVEQDGEQQGGADQLSKRPPFYPSVTPDLLPVPPIDAIQEGAGAAIPVLMGTNTDETALWGTHRTTAEGLEQVVGKFAPDPSVLIDAVRSDRPDASPGDIAMAVSTDHMFRIPMIRMAEARERHDSTTWVYEFDWKSRSMDGALGSCHALEIPFAYGTLGAKGTDAFLGTDDLPHELGDTMHKAWTAFIRSGSPVTAELAGWAPYEAATRSVMRFADEVHVVNDPWPAARQSWDGIR